MKNSETDSRPVGISQESRDLWDSRKNVSLYNMALKSFKLERSSANSIHSKCTTSGHVFLAVEGSVFNSELKKKKKVSAVAL